MCKVSCLILCFYQINIPPLTHVKKMLLLGEKLWEGVCVQCTVEDRYKTNTQLYMILQFLTHKNTVFFIRRVTICNNVV